MSASEVPCPMEKRTVANAVEGSTPIASKTCEGWIEPTMQAEPLETQTPSRSSPIKSDSPSAPGKLTFKVFASERAGSPLRIAFGQVEWIECQRRSRSGSSRADWKSICAVAYSAAAARPAMAATFSVPGRREFS